MYLIWLKVLKCIVARRRPAHSKYDRQTDDIIDDVKVLNETFINVVYYAYRWWLY